MGVDAAEIEKLLAVRRAERETAEGQASHAAESLVRLASNLRNLDELDPDEVRAAADDYAGAIERLKLLAAFEADLRRLLI